MRLDARKNYELLLSAAQQVVAEQGADASLREIARRAGVVVGTLYRHFPTREALLEAVLHDHFVALKARAATLEAEASPQDALRVWMRECYEFTRTYRGVTDMMIAAIDDPSSALHASCKALKGALARLLRSAQQQGTVRGDVDGADMLGLIAAFAWLTSEQPGMANRGNDLYDITLKALLDTE